MAEQAERHPAAPRRHEPAPRQSVQRHAMIEQRAAAQPMASYSRMLNARPQGPRPLQQAPGRVMPTMQKKSGVAVNDDPGLEREADVMGSRAAAFEQADSSPKPSIATPAPASDRSSKAVARAGKTIVAQGKLLPVQGDDAEDAKELVRSRVIEYAAQDPDIGAMVASPSFAIFITLNRDEEGGDQETHVDFNPETRRTFLYITLNQSADDTNVKLAADLLHEFVLHGIPAYNEHRRVENTTAIPNFPSSDHAIEAQEAIEHGDFDAWIKMATIALRSTGPALEIMDAVLHDLLGHAEEAGLSDDEQIAIGALIQRDWEYLAAEGYMGEEGEEG